MQCDASGQGSHGKDQLTGAGIVMEYGGFTKSFLGTGIKFPIQADENTGRWKTSSYEEDIKEAIYIILRTKKGERVRNPEFGCGIYEYVFGTMDYTTMNLIRQEVLKSLEMWEPRIRNIEVEVKTDAERDGCLLVTIDYIVRSTNSPFNLVFPLQLF